MQTYTTYQNAALLILRIITAVIFYVAAYYKLPFWSNAPEGLSPFLLFTTRLLTIAEPLGATAVLLGFLTRLREVKWSFCHFEVSGLERTIITLALPM